VFLDFTGVRLSQITMAESPEERDDEFFKEVYGKEYTGPPTLNTEKSLENSKSNKRSRSSGNAGGESDEEQQERDPNAVPTDFTSREARAWEAKSKAIERNWKRKKEEEFICKICGESGHFTQGCPTTLGGNRTREFIEKIPVKDKHLKSRIIGSGGSVIQKIEKDTGCKIRVEDNVASGDVSFFVRISGPDRLCLKKGTDAVRKLVNEGEDDGKNHSSRQGRTEHTASQRQHSRSRSPRWRPRNSHEEKHAADHHFSQIEGRRKSEGGSSHGRSSPNFASSYLSKADRGSYQRHGQALERSMYEGEKWVPDVRGKELDPGFRGDQRVFPHTLEELEQEFSKEALELFRMKCTDEDEENMKHRERLSALREAFQKNMISIRVRQAKQWEDFMHRETHALQRQYQQQLDRSHSSYNGIGNAGYGSITGGVSGHNHYMENSITERQNSRYSASYDVFQGTRPNAYGERETYNAGLYGNPQPFRTYR